MCRLAVEAVLFGRCLGKLLAHGNIIGACLFKFGFGILYCGKLFFGSLAVFLTRVFGECLLLFYFVDIVICVANFILANGDIGMYLCVRTFRFKYAVSQFFRAESVFLHIFGKLCKLLFKP